MNWSDPTPTPREGLPRTVRPPSERPQAAPATLARFDEMKAYVGFHERDEALLQALRAPAAADLPRMLGVFYGTIEMHQDAVRVFDEMGGDRDRLRKTLSEWVLDCLSGPWDADYLNRRRAIGQAHVRHQLPQRYMMLAMDIVRNWLTDLAFEVCADRDGLKATLAAINKLLDMELALMLDSYRDDLLARMQRQERLATIGELAASIHHELKNPLAAIDAALFALGERRSVRVDPRSRDLLRRARTNGDRASSIISDLLSFARLRTPQVSPTDLDELVANAVGRVPIPPRCRLRHDLDPALPHAAIDGPQIEQVLVNLLQNAFDACSEGGTVTISTRLVGERIQVTIGDDGEGIAPDDLSRVFEPLYSTKPEGIGLGLSLSRNLVHANRGTLALTSAPGAGTTVVLELPAS